MDKRKVASVAASIATLHLDLRSECLWWGEQQIGLTPKAFSVLRYLVEHKDRLVTKQALLDAVWRDSYVEEGQVKQFVAELRRILHDDARSPRFIETVRGRGYRLIGDIALRSPELNLIARALPITETPAGAAAAGEALGAAAGHLHIERVRGSGFLVTRSRPSIVVLPFRGLCFDASAGSIAEALTECVIDGLARSRSMCVIARQSALRYRERHDNARAIAADLGAGYILDGAVQRSGPRLRASVNLVDATQECAIWAQRYDGADDDSFRFQDHVASSIVAAIDSRLFEAEVTRLRCKSAQTFDAYDCVLRAASLLHTLEDCDLNSAGAYLDRAIELDSTSARAHAYKAWWYVLCIGEARSPKPVDDTLRAEVAAQRAVALDPTDGLVLAIAAHVEALLQRQPEVAAEMFDRSLRLNENSAFAWGLSGATYCYLGKADEALARLENADRLNPFDPLSYFSSSAIGLAEFLGGRYDRSISWLKKALRQNRRFVASHRTLASCLWHAGREDEARAAARNLLAVDPSFRLSAFAARYPLRRPGDLKRYMAGLRAAGLPE